MPCLDLFWLDLWTRYEVNSYEGTSRTQLLLRYGCDGLDVPFEVRCERELCETCTDALGYEMGGRERV